MVSRITAIVLLLLVLPLRAGFAETAGSGGLPGGASSLSETYESWQVGCQTKDGAKHCSLSQQQVAKNGQRLLLVELSPAEDGGLAGTLVLPFGLLLGRGVAAQVDDRPVGEPLTFRTCLPVGCLVPLMLGKDVVARLRAGTTLRLTVASSDTGHPVAFLVPLKGFAAAHDRTLALVR
ncbi:Invasion protein IalB, involved in pathogenesis [Tistlia consotensis]|uniref:Invasion protein IalB, involved in pathogenesis n=1 Tax=Tistlia consotensis USBA 355 TaxID=560819 RepID=A0A1Y6CAD0_9PROT|nr:invasion associated locus B family protein [Tistlia consotensis]SMF45385.1 Invasion protein IalB, involved in pathogenesis [Tistlia consotensis USBA 355]SNR79962.1 Invasion protein IalB, involved in pathogenesis [Tistlia consotensis]